MDVGYKTLINQNRKTCDIIYGNIFVDTYFRGLALIREFRKNVSSAKKGSFTHTCEALNMEQKLTSLQVQDASNINKSQTITAKEIKSNKYCHK